MDIKEAYPDMKSSKENIEQEQEQPEPQPEPDPEPQPEPQQKQPLLERYSDKQRDAFRYMMYALIITLGLAIHTLFDNIIQRYSHDFMLTRHQVFLTRVFYVIGVFILVWSMKVIYT